MLPAAATLHPGQLETGGEERLSPHGGKLGPQGSTQGPNPPGWGLPHSRSPQQDQSSLPISCPQILKPSSHLYPKRSAWPGGRGNLSILFLQLPMPL